ncbi:MAG: hypothetical protein IID33_17390 [Planctomycetes bacterium]|nr:hypothetical protein [Planctomycetota bacterium]
MPRIEQLQKLVQMDPDDALGHYGLALEYLNLEQWGDAAASFASTIERDPNCAAAYYHKARAEIAARSSDEAHATLTRGIEVAGAVGDEKTQREMRELLDTVV